MSEYDRLLLEAYNGEVFGDAFFGALADKQPDPDRREKLETLQTVEARTATSLRRLVAAAGLHTTAADDAHRSGIELAAKVDPENWHEFLEGLRAALPSFLQNFERLVELAPSPTDPALVALVNHEKAIDRFAELELGGDGRGALRALQQHLRRPA